MSDFVDEVRVRARAGDGGAGSVSFQREKHKPRGGPDGGDGGRGGSVELLADPSLGSLAPYARRREQRAGHGGKGGGNNRRGADGTDLVLPVPVGTIVRDAMSRELLADLAKPGTRYVLARGGRGGRGNAAMRSKHDRVPNFAEQGEPGEHPDVVLELHLVADVGLIGPPNAGKSTLLGAISRADPKVADYPFTTLIPGLGVVERGESRLVVADLPGLIEGAAEGKGLGLRFLRHAERCAVLVAVVDVAGADPVADLETVSKEVETYDPDLVQRLRVVAGNKIDLEANDVDAAQAWADRCGMSFVAISAAAEMNLDELMAVISEEVSAAWTERGDPETFAVFRPVPEDRIEIRREDDAFRVISTRVERVVDQTAMGNPRAVRRLQQKMRTLGVEAALRRNGAKEGDEIRIGDVAFEYFPDVQDA